MSLLSRASRLFQQGGGGYKSSWGSNSKASGGYKSSYGAGSGDTTNKWGSAENQHQNQSSNTWGSTGNQNKYGSTGNQNTWGSTGNQRFNKYNNNNNTNSGDGYGHQKNTSYNTYGKTSYGSSDGYQKKSYGSSGGYQKNNFNYGGNSNSGGFAGGAGAAAGTRYGGYNKFDGGASNNKFSKFDGGASKFGNNKFGKFGGGFSQTPTGPVTGGETISFGAHKGKAFSELLSEKPDYAVWCAKQIFTETPADKKVHGDMLRFVAWVGSQNFDALASASTASKFAKPVATPTTYAGPKGFLEGKTLVCTGKTAWENEQLRPLFAAFGGKLVTTITDKTTHLVLLHETVDKIHRPIRESKKYLEAGAREDVTIVNSLGELFEGAKVAEGEEMVQHELK